MKLSLNSFTLACFCLMPQTTMALDLSGTVGALSNTASNVVGGVVDTLTTYKYCWFNADAELTISGADTCLNSCCGIGDTVAKLLECNSILSSVTGLQVDLDLSSTACLTNHNEQTTRYQTVTVEAGIITEMSPCQRPDQSGTVGALSNTVDNVVDQVVDTLTTYKYCWFNADAELTISGADTCLNSCCGIGDTIAKLLECNVILSSVTGLQVDSDISATACLTNHFGQTPRYQTVTIEAGIITEMSSCQRPDNRGGPGAMGDPHIKTWTGNWFDYMGQCDIVLLHVSDFDGKGNDLDVHIRTTIQQDQYSYIESAAIQIGSDVLEVASYGDISVNRVDSPDFGDDSVKHLAGYGIFHTMVNKKKHTVDVVLGPNTNITLGSYKYLVSVSVVSGGMGSKFFGRSSGFMGSFSGILLARDGVTVLDEDMNVFGQEWQVRREEEPMLFRSAREPQYPEKCVLPRIQAARTKQRRLGETIARKIAEEACAGVSGNAFKACVFDVMSVGDVEAAEIWRV